MMWRAGCRQKEAALSLIFHFSFLKNKTVARRDVTRCARDEGVFHHKHLVVWSGNTQTFWTNFCRSARHMKELGGCERSVVQLSRRASVGEDKPSQATAKRAASCQLHSPAAARGTKVMRPERQDFHLPRLQTEANDAPVDP